MVVKFSDGSTSSISHARWAMTQHLGRVLGADEHVDHVNEDPRDDRVGNLQLLSLAENSRKSQLGKVSPLRGKEKGWSHGTVYGWMKKRCKCAECQQAKSEWRDSRNVARRKPGGRGPYKKRS